MREGWTYKKLGEVCDKSQNINWNKVSEEKRYTYIDLSSVDRECLSVINPQIINKTNAPSRAKQIVETGDVIFATTRPTLRRTCVIGEDNNGQICSTGFCVLRPQKQVLAKWIFYNLQYDGFYSYIEPLQTGANYPAVADSVVKDYNIPVPSLSEQQSIVAELDKINELINLKKAQLSDLDSLAQSIFYDMFGDPIENEKGWEVKNIDDICSSIVRGPFGSALKKEFFVKPDSTTYKVYEQKHAIQKDSTIGSYYVTENKFNELSRFEIKPNDIIMSCSGTIGELYRIPQNAAKGIMNQALLKFTLNESILYQYFMFLMEYVKKNFTIRGTGLQNIGSVKIIKSMSFGLPPLTLQQDFAKRIEFIEQQKAQISSTIKDLETLLASRMQYWFD